MSFNGWTVEQTAVNTFQGMLLSNKKTWTIDTHNNLDESQGNSAEKPIPKDSILYDCLYNSVEITKLIFLTYLFLAVLGLHCCAPGASRGYSLVVHKLLTAAFLCCRAWALGLPGFSSCSSKSTGFIVVVAGLAAPRHLRSSQIRDRTRVSCIGRWILYRWAT